MVSCPEDKHIHGPSDNFTSDNFILQSSYDSVSSYDSYNNRLGPNAHDDLKCGTSNGTRVSPRNHDPYRFTRSTAQPIGSKNEKPSKPPDYNKYRYANIIIIKMVMNSVGMGGHFPFC
jgi:tight junction protein 1